MNCDCTNAMPLLERMFEVELDFLGSDGRDVESLARAFHADVVVHEPASLPYAGDWKGLEGIAALLGRMRDVWSDMTVEDDGARGRHRLHVVQPDAHITRHRRRHPAALCRSPALQGRTAARRHAVLLRHRRDHYAVFSQVLNKPQSASIQP